MTKTKKIINKISAILLLIITVFTLLITPLTAYASTTKSSNVDITTSSVRDDLASMDEDKLSYYSQYTNIFIAMSQYYDKDENLRTYVYFNYVGDTSTPLQIYLSVATKDSNDNITEDFQYYELSFVNNDSTWVKYEVLGLPNIENVTRRYKIAGIYSEHSAICEIDETYIFHGLSNDSIEVFNQEIETITITEKEVRFFCYGEESKWYEFWGIDGLLGNNKKYTDAWYIFFNTDKPMDDLLEIEITYKPYDYHIQFLAGCNMSYEITDEVLQNRIDGTDFDEETTLTYGEQTVVTITPGKTKVSETTNWWGGYETAYQELDNIMDLREYEAKGTEENPFVFTEQAKKYTWGVNFLNTEKTSLHKGVNVMGTSVTTTVVDGSGVRNTAILRLKYEINGVVKNAYAFDIPTDDFEGSDAQIDLTSFEDIFERILSIIMLLVLVIIIVNIGIPVLFPLFKLLVKAVSGIISIIVSIFALPFKLISGRKRR